MRMLTRRSSAGLSFGAGLRLFRVYVNYARSIQHVSGTNSHISLTFDLDDFRRKNKQTVNPWGTLTIAVDGHSSTGKSTLARQLASKLDLAYVDSGAMYRAVALYGLREGCIVDQKVDAACLIAGLDSIELRFGPEGIYLNGEAIEGSIRRRAVNEVVSEVSSISAIRRKMVELQQQMEGPKGVVMDGRDIGTVVFPKADLKIYMTAHPQIRAQRRFEELKAKGKEVALEEIAKNLTDRDRQDMQRLDSPLLKADDALELDNSDLSMEQQLHWVLEKLGTD